MKPTAIIGLSIFAVVAVVGLYFGGFIVQRDASTRSQNIETSVFHNTQAYTDGKAQAIDKLRREYETASAADKPILRAQIQREAATVDLNLLPADTKSFVESLR